MSRSDRNPDRPNHLDYFVKVLSGAGYEPDRAFSGRGDGQQTKIDFGGKLTAGAVPGRIRRESRDESAKGGWFEHLFMLVARQ